MRKIKKPTFTDIDKETLTFINAYWSVNHHPPTTREIVDNTSVSSSSVAHYIIHKLEQMNMIRIVHRHAIPHWIDDAIDLYKSVP